MAKKQQTTRIPKRSEVQAQDTWDLSKIFSSDAVWEKNYKKLEKMIPGYEKFRGKLGRSAKTLRQCLEFDAEFDQLGEKLGAYASLRASEDVANPDYQGMIARFTYVATRASEAASFIAPELRTIPKQKMTALLRHKDLEAHRFQLEKLLRYRPHILSDKEERLLAMQGEIAGTPSKVFGQLTDADLKYGFVINERGEEVELTQSSFRSLLESPKRSVRKDAFDKFYGVISGHGHTIAASLSGSVLQDVYQARVRNYPSAREAALFSDRVPVRVYDNLIEQVHENLDTVYRYLEVRQKALKLKDLHMYDTYVPIVKEDRVDNPYENAVATICDALAPLGSSYVETMRNGLLEQRWVDRYENEGKRSGAFSYGAYKCAPYILMNYKSDVLDSMFTLAHEAGHSMHSWHSMRNQPYQYAHYTIFVAEVASTFNEQLLNKYLLDNARTKKERARLINREIDEIRGTIVRQTMFAEFEKIIHAIAEVGEPLTQETFREEYRKLLDLYFGRGFVVDELLELEGLRIPHFYSAFYVYKYATGLSAAIALSRKVIEEGPKARDRYLKFLSSGGSKYPLDLLKDAGVDMSKPQPVATAMNHFRELVDQLEELV
jgi:oligoendopeptidase F